MIRFVADESCDYAAVRALRAADYDVIAVAEAAPQTEDPDVLALAYQEDRILLTEDKDFGQLVFSVGQRAAGVVLFRFPPSARDELGQAVVEMCRRLGEGLRGSFVVLEPGKLRISRLPSQQ